MTPAAAYVAWGASSFHRCGLDTAGGGALLSWPMKTNAYLPILFSAALLGTAHAQFVTVGDPGNPNDQDYGPGAFGAVATTYAIGTYEVTLNQYAAFLNAKAAADPFDLYNPAMGTYLNTAGISRTGSSGSYVYGVIGTGTRPVTYVSFYDAMRYANWLGNGGGSGDTETGAYTLLGGTPVPSNGLTVTRNGGATVWVPSENEWYKAAYYQPFAAGGDVDGYWLLPTRTNTLPVSNSPGAGTNRGNFYDGDFAVTQSGSYSGTQNYLTPVGAYTDSESYYGTYDQGGNATEWNDTIIDGSSRGRRGGSWRYYEPDMRASAQYGGLVPHNEDDDIGFRIATVPEPTVSVSLLLAGGLLIARWKRPSAL